MDTFRDIGNGVASLGKGSMNLVGDVAKGTAKLGKGSIHMVGNVAKGTVNAVEYVGKGTVNIAGSGFEAVGLKKSKKDKSEEEISPEESEEESEIPESEDESEETTDDDSSDSVESEVPAPSKKTKSPTKTFGFFGKKKEAAYVESDEDLPEEVDPEKSFEDESSSEEDETTIEKELKIFTENVLKQIKKTAEVAMIPSARIKDIINFTMNFKDGSTWTYDVILQKKEKYREVITAEQTLPVVDEISEDEDSDDEKDEEVEEVEEPPKEFSESGVAEGDFDKPVKKGKKNKKKKVKKSSVGSEKIESKNDSKIDSKPETTKIDSKLPETTATKPFNILPFSRKKPEPDAKSHVSLDITKSTETMVIASNNALTSNTDPASNGSNLRGQDAVLRGILPLYSSVGMVPPSVGEIKIPTCLGVVMSLRWELGVTSNLELTN